MKANEFVRTFLDRVKPVILAYRNGDDVAPETIDGVVDLVTPYLKSDDPLLEKAVILAMELDEHSRDVFANDDLTQVDRLIYLFNELEYELSIE